LLRLEALERAVESAVRDLERDHDVTALSSLKLERDQLRRLLNEDWEKLRSDLSMGRTLRLAKRL